MNERYWLFLGGRLLLAAIIVGWAASYLYPGGGSAEKEFQRSLDAMKQVRSLRVNYSGQPQATLHNEMSWELVCSQNAYHLKQHLTSSDPASPIDQLQDDLYVGSAHYVRQAGGDWQPSRYPGSSATANSFCTQFAQGTEANLMPQIATMMKRGIIEKGDKKTVNGVRCREWKVAMRGAPSGLEHDTVCLGLDDHLPYEATVDWMHSTATYSDYNSNFQLEVPAAGLQPASAPN